MSGVNDVSFRPRSPMLICSPIANMFYFDHGALVSIIETWFKF